MPDNDAYDFLSAIFGGKPAAHNVLIWELNRQADSKNNKFFTDIDAAASYAASQKPEGTDVYFCVGTLPALRRGRGKLNDILGIGSIHLDVDVQNSDAHKKGNLPKTIEEAVALVNSFDIKPSIIVGSGYGIHAYWLLTEFIDFVDEATRTAAANLIERWQKMFKWKAGLQGYDVDATQDLTRVLRVPDTLNWKIPLHPVYATILHLDANLRYTPGQLTGFMDQMREVLTVSPVDSKKKPVPKTNLTPYNDIDIVLDPGADLDAATFEALMENIPKFKPTWMRARKDMQDTSGSSYDISLANMAVGAGLSDQQVCDLLIAHRRKHGDEKPRLDYYQRTIAEARNVMQVERQRSLAAKRVNDPDDKEALKNDIYTILGIKLNKIEMLKTEPPQFIFYFDDGRSKNFGDAAGLLDQKRFAIHVGNTIRRVINQVKELQYRAAVQKMYDLAVEVEVADEATEVGEIKDILNAYVAEHLVLNTTESAHRINAAHHAPAVIKGWLCINALELWQYAKRRYSYRGERKHVIGMLKRIGANTEKYNVKDENGKQCGISVYSIPMEFLPEGAVKVETDAPADFEYAGKGL